MLVTVLAILAVDFPVFPRMLAKCETYGVSFVRIFSMLAAFCGT
jgi:phosphatidylinositol glycan class W